MGHGAEVEVAKLSAKTVAAMKLPGMHSDSDTPGLYLRVGPTGAKSWILRTLVHGKRREMGLGSVDVVGLAEARDLARAHRKIARQGGDPLAERKRTKGIPSFHEAAQTVHEALLPTWRNKKHAETWLATVESYAVPKVGSRPIDTITSGDVLEVLSPIWTAKPETAKRLKQRLGTIMDWAKGKGYLTAGNPVTGIERALPRIERAKVHMAALPWRDVPGFMADLAIREGVSARCLEFIILTAARSGEARGARWEEIDFAAKVWTVPAARMKRKKAHRVPLSEAALAALNAVNGMDPALCFPSPQRTRKGGGKPLSDMVFKSLFARMHRQGFVTHGFRSSFRDWAGESAHAPREVAEACLSHATGNTVEQSYARSDLLERRRGLMDAWGRFATGEAGEVVELVRA